jgi:hypothetical protein
VKNLDDESIIVSLAWPNLLHDTDQKRGGQGWHVGMDSDVWKSELSVFVSAKNINMDMRIRIRF